MRNGEYPVPGYFLWKKRLSFFIKKAKILAHLAILHRQGYDFINF